MSLGLCIKGPEGLVLAAESRVTLQAKSPTGDQVYVGFDNATKLLAFSRPNTWVGAVTYGQAAIGGRTAHSFLPEFESALPEDRLSIADFAQHLSDFYMAQWQAVMPDPYKGPPMTLVIGGFDDGEAYGRVYEVNIPFAPTPVLVNQHKEFGIHWGGQREFVDRLLQGFDSGVMDFLKKELKLKSPEAVALSQKMRARFQMALPIDVLALQDCVDLAFFFLRTTIDAQRLTVGIRGCGGPIDVATITRREGLTFVQKKAIHPAGAE